MRPRSRAVLAAVILCAWLSEACASEHAWQSYSQVRYTAPEDQASYLALRRLKLYGQGPISGEWTYFLQFLYKDGNNSLTDDRIVMQEANVSHPVEFGKLTLGQFKPPFGLERFTSDMVLALIDRSQPTDRLIPNGSLGWSFARARGAQIENRTGPSIQCAVGIFDGNGANQPFEGNGPLVVGRLAYQPALGESRRYRSELALSWRKDHNIDFLGQLPGAPSGYANFAGTDVRQNIAIAYDFGKNSIRPTAPSEKRQALSPTAAVTSFIIDVGETWHGIEVDSREAHEVNDRVADDFAAGSGAGNAHRLADPRHP